MSTDTRLPVVLITGAEGMIGTILRAGLADRFKLVALTRYPQDIASVVADITDIGSLVSAFTGVDTVIHLAAAVNLEAPWEDLLPHNIVGTRNVFEAARRPGVRSVIFTSSAHANGFAEEEAGAALYALEDGRVFHPTDPVRPDSHYAVAKVFGETLGRYYVDQFGLRVICVRVGTVIRDNNLLSTSVGHGWSERLSPQDRFPRLRAKWLSHRDCCQLFARCIEAVGVTWAVVFGTSNNPRQFLSLDEAREKLGYSPEDAAPPEPPSRPGQAITN